MYNVLIVEDQSMPRQLLEIFVSNSPGYHLVASIANAELAPEICDLRPIDLILMDVMTEYGKNGLDASEIIKRKHPAVKIIVVTSMVETNWLRRAREIGVDSFWYKDSDRDTILSVMDRTMKGESIYPDTVPTVHIGITDNHDFTDRELDVLRELISGDSNTEIAARLGISPGTVKFHVQNLLIKTGFHTRTELATEARSLGIVIRDGEKP